MGRTAEQLAAAVKLTREQKTLIHLAQRCQHTIDGAANARDARDGALAKLAAEGVPAPAIYTATGGPGRAVLSESTVAHAMRGRRR